MPVMSWYPARDAYFAPVRDDDEIVQGDILGVFLYHHIPLLFRSSAGCCPRPAIIQISRTNDGAYPIPRFGALFKEAPCCYSHAQLRSS